VPRKGQLASGLPYWLLGFVGPRHEAEEIKRQIGAFLREQLNLELSDAKTLITHARTQAARFLGYEIVVLHNDQKHDRRGHRSINGQVGLKVPLDVVRDHSARYRRHGKAIHRAELAHDSVYSIVAQYQQEYRGVVEYYQLAYNLYQFNRLKWLMERSLVQTLAHKLRLSVSQVYRRYHATLQTARGPRVGLQVTVERGEGRKPLVAAGGGVPLARRAATVLNDSPLHICGPRTELERRLLAHTCELCGSQVDIQVHHVRALKDLRRKGQADRPLWVKIMAARQRKTLVTCRACHADIHAGRTTQHAATDEETLESRVLRKGAPHHPMFDPSRREGRYGRLDLRVTHPTWTRKREGKVAWWEVRPKRRLLFCRAQARPHSGEVSNAVPYLQPKGVGGH